MCINFNTAKKKCQHATLKEEKIMAVGKARPVNETIWLDSKIKDKLQNWEKYLFIYLLTNSHLEQVGIYEITFNTISYETGLTHEQVTRGMKKLEEVELISYDDNTNEVAILNYLKHSILGGGKPYEKCFYNLGKKVKSRDLLIKVYNKAISVNDGRDIYCFALEQYKKAINEVKSNKKFATEAEEREALIDEICKYEEFLAKTGNDFVFQKIRQALPNSVDIQTYSISYLKSVLNMIKNLTNSH